MTIGERIREARTAKGLTQEQLAEQVHVTKQAVYKYETGRVAGLPCRGGTGRFDSGRTHCRLPESERPTDPGR